MNIIIKSRDRENQLSDASNCSIQLKQAIQGRYQIMSVVMTNNIYTIDNSNNKIYFYENNTSKIATITNGYYSDADITGNIKTAMNTASSGYNSFTVNLNTNTKKLTISASNPFKFEFSKSNNDDAADLIGFYRYNDSDQLTSHTMPYVRDLSGCKAVLLQLSNCVNNEFLTVSDRFNNHIIGNVYIPLNVNYGEIKYMDTFEFPTIINLSSTDRIHIKIIDVQNGNIRPINGELILALKKVDKY